ncbi:MAG TPA: hypothetical protein VGX49_14950 [Jatrophihabitans sp.]|jgi:thiol-disulfide isomerase/thioredoxin|nr:hypothetical protein [Jatrophihabitans sp.]
MTVTTVLVVYTTLVATLALGISLLILRLLPVRTPLPAGGAVSLPASGPDVASPAPPIRARTSTAALLDTAELAGRSYLLAFLSSSCQGCRAALPAMTNYASQLPGDQRLIAVIVGDPRRGADIERQLAQVATIVSEPEGGPIAAAYRIAVFPSYVLVSETGTVLATGQSVLDLPQPQPQ